MADDGIRAYQGGPHSVGEEGYSDEWIGSGEGAQAYGHGHYFAEHEPVAIKYRDKLGGVQMSPYYLDLIKKYYTPGNIVPSYSGRTKILDSKFEDNGFLKHVVAMPIDKEGKSTQVRPNVHQTIPRAEELMGFFGRENVDKAKLYQPAGHMHEVRINAHPDHFLDWDNPIGDQSQHVWDSLYNSKRENQSLWNVFKEHIGSEQPMGEFYRKVAVRHPRGYAGATDFLQRAGIHGIKYLDRSSRNTGQGTYNYVVFDPKRIEIKRRYEYGGMVDGYEEGGFISKLENRIRNEQGHVAAKRVQRAADEIPGLEKMYTPDALQRAFEDRAALASMPPEKFLKLALRLEDEGGRYYEDDKGNKLTQKEYADFLAHKARTTGLSDVPFLGIKNFEEKGKRIVRGDPYIFSHEGRHRNLGMQRADISKGLVSVFPNGETEKLNKIGKRISTPEFVEKMNELVGPSRMVSPQTIYSKNPKILHALPKEEMPEFYDKGGRTKRATGGRIPEVDKLFKSAKKELDGTTKPMLAVDDDHIVKALRIMQGRV